MHLSLGISDRVCSRSLWTDRLVDNDSSLRSPHQRGCIRIHMHDTQACRRCARCYPRPRFTVSRIRKLPTPAKAGSARPYRTGIPAAPSTFYGCQRGPQQHLHVLHCDSLRLASRKSQGTHIVPRRRHGAHAPTSPAHHSVPRRRPRRNFRSPRKGSMCTSHDVDNLGHGVDDFP